MSYLSDLLQNKRDNNQEQKTSGTKSDNSGSGSYLGALLNGKTPGSRRDGFNEGVGKYNYVMDSFGRWYDQSMSGLSDMGRGNIDIGSTNQEAASWMNRAGELREWANEYKDMLGDDYDTIMDSLQQVTTASYWMDRGYKNQADTLLSKFETIDEYDQYMADEANRDHWTSYDIVNAYDERQKMQAPIDVLRSDYNDLYELEGAYGLLANDAVPEEERQRNQARYDEIVSRYGEGITAEDLYYQLQQLEGEYGGRIAQLDAEIAEAYKYQGQSGEGGKIGSSIPWDDTPKKTADDYRNELEQLEQSIASMSNYIDVLDARYEELDRSIAMYSSSSDPEDISRLATAQNELDMLLAQRNNANQEYDAMMSQKWQLEHQLQYDTLGENSDYRSASVYNVGNADDQLYRYINNRNGITSFMQEGDKYSEDSTFISDNPDYVFGFMSDEQVANYNYIYATQGRDAAMAYLEYLRPQMDTERTDFLVGEATELTRSGVGGAIVANALSVPLNLTSGIGFFDIAAQNMARDIRGDYAPINYNSSAMTATHLTRAIRNNTAAMITDATGTIQLDPEKHPFFAKILNGRGLAYVYQLGMSAIDSKVAALTGHPALAMTLLASSAATQGILNALERGATDEQALQMGFWDGIAEAVFEYFEVENLLKGDPNWIRATLNQALTEGIGEGLTSVANNITDFLVMADKSQIMQSAAEYENQGYNRNQAIWNAIADAAIDAGWDMLGGMASGGISAGGMSGVQNAADTRSTGRYVQQNQMVDPLMELANQMAGLGDYQGKVQTYAQKVTQRPSAYNVGRLYNETTRVIDQQNMDQLAVALQDQGLTQSEATKLASALALDLNGIELTKGQERLLAKYEGNDSVIKAVVDVIGSEAYMNRSDALGRLYGNTTTKAQPSHIQMKTTEKTETPQAKVETTHAVSEDGETHLVAEPEKTVSIKGIESIEDGKMMLKLDDGRVVDSKDVIFGNEDDALVYEILADMNVSAENANAIMQEFKTGNVPASEFALDLQEAYQYGRDNQTLKEANRSASAQLVWNDARMASMAETDTRQAQVEETYQKATEVLKQTGKKRGEYHASLEEGIEVTSLSETQKASYELEDRVAQAAKVDISVYDGKTGEWGYYEPKTDTIHLNLNATNMSRKSMMAFVLGHELAHRAKAGSPKKFRAFADFLVAEYGKRGVTLDELIEEQILAAKEHGIDMSRDEAFDEVVCDSCQMMLLDTDAGKKLAMFGAESKQNHSFLEDLKRWITEFIDKLRSLFVDVDPDSLAAQEFSKFDDGVKQILADMFVDMTMEAGEHLSAIKEALGTDALIELNNSGEFTMAQNADGSEKVFNLVTWNKGGRSTMEATLLREGYTQEEVNAALTIMDAKQQLVEDIASELDDNGDLAFPEQGRINEAVLTTDIKTGHAVLTALVSNGDYPVNIDLLMVCKKRKAYQRVINRLCETGLIKTATVDALAIAEINKILGKYGFETACLGCFVESRRLRIQEWAQTIVKEWNGQVKKRDPKAKPFGFGKGEATLTADEIMQLIGELESGGPKNDKGNLNLGQGSAVKRIGVLLDKVPSLRRTLAIEDLVTPDGLSALGQFDGNLFSMVKSRYGSNSPKFVQEFNPYNHELAMYGKVPAEYKSLREYLYAIGGARMQSFSDFIVENWFDYCQIVADLAARKLPMHTYTKEIALARLFGMTGIKVNMSLIPDIDRSLGKEYAGLTIGEDGKLQLIWADKDRYKTTGGQSYMQSINYADAIALQQDPRYSSNVGTIAIGVSDRQIRMMLADPNIRMVIPYHSSGMNPIFADMMGTSFYKDYTNFQNTAVKQMYDSKGKPVSVKLDKTQVGKLTSGFLFNETLQKLGDARAVAEAYKEWCADASLHTITIKGETYTAVLTPKFNDFAKEDNYYKLLEDFNCYDCITEEAAPQRDVQQVYPENFEKILRDELKGQEGYRQKQEKNQAFDKAMAEIEGYLETHTKADTVYYAQQKGIKLSEKDKKLDAAGKEKLKQLQKDGARMKIPKSRDFSYQELVAKPDLHGKGDDFSQHLLYKLPVGTDTSPRALLANAFESVAQTDIEKSNLEKYRSNLADLEEMEAKLSELKAQIKELSFAKGKRDKEKINKLKFEANATANRIETLDNILVRFEASEPIRKIIELEKEKVRVRTKEKVSEAAKNRRDMERESMQKRDARAKLDKLVLDTVGWITAPKKGVVKCPDILKKPYMDFLNGIDMSSKTMANGGDPTKADLRMANALGSLTDTIEKITMGQDPSKESTDVFDSGYLDLPADFVKQLRDMTNKIRDMMENDGYVINSMTAQQVRDLAKHIRTLNHAIREMGTLYANKRFANAKALGKDSMHFMDALGETDGTSSVKDFVQWQNALPYYAFKRFGLGGESVFEGMMDAQDKLAFLAKQIFDFQKKTWTGDEADAWSKDVHTVELENDMTEDGKVIPRSIRLTTADAMSIYCLYQREQGRKHLLGGGVRVIGIQKGSKKSPDSITNLTVNDIDTIIGSLNDRQVKVAEAMQKFMSTVCAEWGNEISMKRFLTREFTETNYFPIESDDENMTQKDPAAQQSDLFRLLNISATKGIDPNANNRAIVRNIFDVFSGHAADMARLNAFALPLLDYMKWFNYREKTVTEKGQVINRGVRESMRTAYGDAAKRYVMNLIKDVNGRPSDGGLPSFYSRMLKNAKTAMVGSSLRVATLQITSYPRAALVLSPKSLALGLHKLPNIKMAQKYCGIALWKSFGFYDTNISRTIEEQMKGVKDVRQKIIELSLKGAEIGDALTWGVLWNACEYEVAATNKYETGTEEFYKAVGKKLREVVYATQVVDSILTRSEAMRSKDSKMKELTSFMSEPTLSANILMDAGFQFGMEKRRNGGGKVGAKEAWKVTGKYVGRAIAVYSIGQLAAALLEGLWDAWRDDDDEEFWRKYLKSFAENLALDIIPFNKIPILSDIAEAALSLFGLGIFSTDNLSSTALSQTVAAFKAWADVLNGKGSATVYNALYKSIRAVSSVLGVSISGVMREGVDLWNNTVGAFDNTLKIRTYESADNRSDKLFKALKNGDQKYLDKFVSSYSDEENAQAAIRKEVKDRYLAGEISESEARNYLTEYGGLDTTEAYWKMKEWDFDKEDATGEDFAKYDRFYEAVKTGVNLKAVIKEYTDNGVELDTLRSQITEHFKLEYVDMSASNRACIKGYILNAMVACGQDREKAEMTLMKWDFEASYGYTWDDRGDAYRNGAISASKLVDELMAISGKTREEAELQVEVYDWQKDIPNCDITAAGIRDYHENCESAGISRKLYYDAWRYYQDTSGEIDEDTGESIPYSKVQKVMPYINGLDLTPAQKTALASCWWGASTVKKYKLW